MKPSPGLDNPGASSHGLAELMAAQRTDMAVQRTALAYQRNKFAADRTLMAIMRTALSMIAFGFVIFSCFNLVTAREAIGHGMPEHLPVRFGLALVVLGVVLLVAGIVADMRYRGKLRRQHRWLRDGEWGDGIDRMDRSLVLTSAIGLLLIGVVAIGVILARIWP